MAFPILPANTLSGGYDIANSCRFYGDTRLQLDSGSPDAANRQVFAFSVWLKRGLITSAQHIITSRDIGGTNHVKAYFAADDSLTHEIRINGTLTTLDTNRRFRDVFAWYHIVYIVDTTQETAANRVKLYVNGTQESSFATEQYPAEDGTIEWFQNTEEMTIGSTAAGGEYFDGYMADLAVINVTAGLTASDFGETDEDSGIWKPKELSGFSGNNSCFLEFKETGTGQNSSGIGADTGGNDKHWAVTNLTANDQCVDTPTNNFAVLRLAIDQSSHSQVVIKEGNCDYDFTGGGSISARRFDQHVVSSFAMTAGKWYCEAKEIEDWRGTFFGISNLTTKVVTDEIESWIAIYGDTGNKYIQEYTGQSVSNSVHGDAIGANATILIALDMDNKNVYFGQRLDSGEPGWSDGSDFNQSSPTSAISISSDFLTIDGDGSSVVFYFAGGGSSETPRFQVNFGNPIQSITSGNADANGYGNFECTVPSGYYALCTKNIAQYGG
jgi:hypothetical protein